MHQVKLNENEPIWQAEISLRYFIIDFISRNSFLTALTTQKEHVLHVQNLSYGDNSRNGAGIRLNPNPSRFQCYISQPVFESDGCHTSWVIDKKKKIEASFTKTLMKSSGHVRPTPKRSFCPSIHESVFVWGHDPTMFPVLHPQGILGCMTRVWPAIFHDAVLHQSDKTVLALICSVILDALTLSVFDVSWAGFNTISVNTVKVCKQTVSHPISIDWGWRSHN